LKRRSEIAIGSTILVVENDPNIRRLLKVALNWQGYRTLLAQNGEEGLAIRSKNPSVAAIVCDMDAPASGGLAFIERVDLLVPGARIIALVGRGEENFRQAKAFGVVRAVLSKPCLIEKFWMTLERVIGEDATLQVAPAVTRIDRDRPASASPMCAPASKSVSL